MPDAASPIDCDVLVVGGGINGTGIARDLAGRGLRVVLAEQDDLASATSSASTKLIHGGLRYLEYYEFALVRKSLAEREVLLKSAPHIMWPLRFVLPHNEAMRPAWMIRAGLFLYDHLARREVLPGSGAIDLRQHPAGVALKPAFTRGFVYSDGWVDDARLVVLCAIDARERGARVLTRARCSLAERSTGGWRATLDCEGGTTQVVQARALVNAAGPWAESFLRQCARPARGEVLAKRSLRLVQGSHIVVRRWFEHDHAYIFQNPDKRIIFAIPYEQQFTLIGTTDVERHGDPRAAAITDAEVEYLCAQASRYFERTILPSEVVWSYAGVRPLIDDASGDPSAVTRDYLLEADTDAAPLLTVWGGKLTTFRKLAEEAADMVVRQLGGSAPGWTHGPYLPGGDLSAWIGKPSRPDLDFERFVAAVGAKHPWLDAGLRRRWAHAYGSRIGQVIGEASGIDGLGREIAPGLYESELAYLKEQEWACTAQDVLWRRSKLGLLLSPAQRDQVSAWFSH